MKKIIRLMLVPMLVILAAPAYSGSATQTFQCVQSDDATDQQVEAIASEWLKAAKGMKGGENLEAYLQFPIAASVGEYDFTFILVAPSFAEWGAFTDVYDGSPAQEVDKRFNGVADCASSTMWESIKVK